MAIPANVFRVALKWADDDGRTAFNILHFKSTLPVELAQNVAGFVKVGPGSAALGAVSATAAVREITVTELADDSNGFVEADVTDGWTGGAGVGDYGPGLSQIIKLHTNASGRSGRGRIFLPFISESAITKGRFIGDAATEPKVDWLLWAQGLENDHDLLLQVWSETDEISRNVVTISQNPIPGFRRNRANQA